MYTFALTVYVVVFFGLLHKGHSAGVIGGTPDSLLAILFVLIIR